MSIAVAPRAHLRYDAHETLADLQARQRKAYQAGKAAWRQGSINGQALQLYDELVRYVGGNRYCWVKEETLAVELGRSVSTIKRWMQQLVQAQLIGRGRRFGTASVTTIAAYDVSTTSTPEPERQRIVANHTAASMADSSVATPAVVDAAAVPPDEAAPPASVFFGPTHEPSIGSFSHPDSMKTNESNPGGGGTGSPGPGPAAFDENDVTSRLKAEGVSDPLTLGELGDRPITQIETVIRYVARCRTPDDPRRPGLIVHLLRRGFGSRTAQRRRDREPRSAAPPPVVGASASPTTMPPAGSQDAPVLAWREALDLLATRLDRSVYETWIAPNQLLALTDEWAVLGTPNCFVRDAVGQHYIMDVQAALREVCGQAIAVEVVIGLAP